MILLSAIVGGLLSILFVAARQIPYFHLELALYILFLISLWATLGIFYALIGRYNQINQLLSEDYVKSRERLRETSYQKVRLEQALEGLANANRQLAQAYRELQAAQAVIPGGVNSPVRAFRAVGGEPFFVARASGSRITDVDGRTYIDYVGSWGPMILGHAPRGVTLRTYDLFSYLPKHPLIVVVVPMSGLEVNYILTIQVQ